MFTLRYAWASLADWDEPRSTMCSMLRPLVCWWPCKPRRISTPSRDSMLMALKIVLERMVVWLRRGLARGTRLTDLVVEIQLRWMAAELDGLIVRKAGREVVRERGSWPCGLWMNG